MIRRIVQIDEEKCNGCGACAAACHEGAIAMIDGKARLIKDDYCDGLGDCLPACPVDAISIIEREAAAYDEEAVKARMAAREQTGVEARAVPEEAQRPHTGCPGMAAKMLDRERKTVENRKMDMDAGQESELLQWPVQIKLVPVKASYFDGAKLLIAADCTAYAYGNFHRDFIKDHVTVIGCPKLDEENYADKLAEIIKNNEIRSIKIVRMEVPCCGGIENAAKCAIQESGKMIPWQVVTIGCDGSIVEEN